MLNWYKVSDYDYISEGNKNFLSNLKLTKISSFSKKKNINIIFLIAYMGISKNLNLKKKSLK